MSIPFHLKAQPPTLEAALERIAELNLSAREQIADAAEQLLLASTYLSEYPNAEAQGAGAEHLLEGLSALLATQQAVANAVYAVGKMQKRRRK